MRETKRANSRNYIKEGEGEVHVKPNDLESTESERGRNLFHFYVKTSSKASLMIVSCNL